MEFKSLNKEVVNSALVGLTFMLLYSAFYTLSNLEKLILHSVKNEDTNYRGDGFISLSILYISFALFMWFVPAVMALTGPKHALTIGAVGFRILWGCLVGVTAVAVTVYISLLGYIMTHSSVEMIVDNPQYDVGLVDFPAVTLCPNSKVMKSKLSKEVDRLQLNLEEKQQFYNTVLALDLMKYPFYHHPQYFMNIQNNSAYPIPNRDILSIMLKIHPMLEDMITNCKWKGLHKDCRQLFQEQTTEEGFCYSFNSQTSVGFHGKKPRSVPESLKNNVAGRGSGLSFELKSLDHEQFKENMVTRGYSVVVHNPNSFPDVSLKYGIFWKNMSFSRFKVTVSTVKADQSINTVAPAFRNCKLDNVVSVNSCLFKCRLNAIIKQCGCLPYYVIHLMNKKTVCGFQHFQCLSLNNKRLRNAYTAGEDYNVPAWSIPQTMDCSCDIPCTYATYVTEHEFVPVEEVNGHLKSSALGSVEVVYKTKFATSYIRKASFTAEKFLVEVGGLASLFLGCSVLTLVELTIFLCKLVKLLCKSFFFRK